MLVLNDCPPHPPPKAFNVLVACYLLLAAGACAKIQYSLRGLKRAIKPPLDPDLVEKLG